ncbi:usherin-like [Salvelinus alpinus]
MREWGGVTRTTSSAKARVDWEPSARPNGVIVSDTVYQRDPALPATHRFLYDPEHSAFSGRSTTLQELTSDHRYEVRVEACTELGCASSDWVSVLLARPCLPALLVPPGSAQW